MNKIKNKKYKDPKKCSIFKVGNKLVEMCEDEKLCTIKNDILECSGLDGEYKYGSINDIGENIAGNIPTNCNIRRKKYNSGRVKCNNQDEVISKLIKNSINKRVQKMNCANTNKKIESFNINKNEDINLIKNNVENEYENESIENLFDQENVYTENIYNFWDKYKIWIILGILFIILLFLLIIIYYSGDNAYKKVNTNKGNSWDDALDKLPRILTGSSNSEITPTKEAIAKIFKIK